LKLAALFAYRSAMSEYSMPPVIRELLATPDPPDLGPGPRAGVESQRTLAARIDDALDRSALRGARADLVRATVLLWHDHFEPAHAIAQEIETRDGSYVHAILHRREPDYGNAKYWFRRVGQHPCFGALAGRVTGLFEKEAQAKLGANLLRHGEWDAFAFVDACEAMAGKPGNDSQVQSLRAIQRVEFEVLVDYLSKA
jgi:hypothetical protein